MERAYETAINATKTNVDLFIITPFCYFFLFNISKKFLIYFLKTYSNFIKII